MRSATAGVVATNTQLPAVTFTVTLTAQDIRIIFSIDNVILFSSVSSTPLTIDAGGYSYPFPALSSISAPRSGGDNRTKLK